MRQLFTKVCVHREKDRYALFCGDKPLLTPARHPYLLPTERMAEALAAEWRAQGDKVVPATMPMTQLAATALDIVAKDREPLLRQALAYASTDLLCHRAERPAALVERQQEIWQPLLDWCALRFGALLCAGSGIMPVAQKPEAITALHAFVSGLDDFTLAGLSHAVDVTGSLVLGLALACHERSAQEVFQAAELDVSFQALTWGTDPVTAARFESAQKDLDVCERWFGMLA